MSSLKYGKDWEKTFWRYLLDENECFSFYTIWVELNYFIRWLLQAHLI